MTTRNPRSFSRRLFIGRAAALTSLAAIDPAAASPIAAQPPRTRAERVYQARLRAAAIERDRPKAEGIPTGDEKLYPRGWNCFTKAFPHNGRGEVDSAAYATYLDALRSGDAAAFERIPLGGYLKLANPQAAFAIDLLGPDAHSLRLRTPPALASAELASELVELYWQALLRDVPLTEYDSHPLARRAAEELSALSDFRGPKRNGRVEPALLFRGLTNGGRTGPYLSQFLLRDIPMTPIRVPQKIRTAVAGREHMTAVDEWLNIQNGQVPAVNTFDDRPRFIATGRDLGEYVHRDYTYQATLDACLILLRMSAPLDGAIPYHYSLTQGGFVTHGVADILHLAAAVANLALKPTWYFKWAVHRTARPEEAGGHLHFHLLERTGVPFHSDLLESAAVHEVRERHGTWLLPQAYPEGAPSHPSYPSGHAVLAGAGVTMLKACFAESWELPNCVVPKRDGSALEPWRGAKLTVGGELDKLAENIAFGRNFGGIHWRSDAIEGLLLGEAYAIAYLQEMNIASHELFGGMTLTRFDGSRVTV
jgi:membrane-associated phospholipid phosphatase